MVYKPNSVPLVGLRSLIWDRRYRLPQATYPESTRIIRADSPERTLPVTMLCHPLPLDGGLLQRTPARRAGASIPYLVLHPVGFAMPVMSPCPRCALTAPFHPYHSEESEFGGIFSVALSRIPAVADGNGWGLPTTAPCGVRTFLPAYAERPPDHFINPIVADQSTYLYPPKTTQNVIRNPPQRRRLCRWCDAGLQRSRQNNGGTAFPHLERISHPMPPKLLQAYHGLRALPACSARLRPKRKLMLIWIFLPCRRMVSTTFFGLAIIWR